MVHLRVFLMPRGELEKDVPYPPLLFMLVIEVLSRLIRDSKLTGKIQGIRLSSFLDLTHFLFVDDVGLFGCGSL